MNTGKQDSEYDYNDDNELPTEDNVVYARTLQILLCLCGIRANATANDGGITLQFKEANISVNSSIIRVADKRCINYIFFLHSYLTCLLIILQNRNGSVKFHAFVRGISLMNLLRWMLFMLGYVEFLYLSLLVPY